MKSILSKAQEGGFKWNSIDSDIIDEEIYLISCNTENDGMNDVYIKWGDGNSTIWYFNEIIFSIPFLKAFFGSIKCDCEQKGYAMHSSDYCKRKPWPYYAQQLVLSEDRIKYLRGFLDE